MSVDRRANQMLSVSIRQIRTVMVAALIFAYTCPYLAQGYKVRQSFGFALNAWGTFACTMSNAKILWVCFTGYLLMLSDLPCFSATHVYEAVRSEKGEIMKVRVLMVLKMTALYVGVLFIFFCVMSGSTDFHMETWDRLHFSYAHGQYVDGIDLDAPLEIVDRYTPVASFCLCAALCLIVFACFGLCLLFLTMMLPVKKPVFALCCAWGGLDMAVDEMGFGYRMYAYSPLSFVRLTILEAQKVNAYYPSKARILTTAVAALALLLTVCLLFPVESRMDRLGRK